MFSQRTPLFTKPDENETKSIDDKVDDVIKSEVHDIVSKRDHKRLTIEEMVQEIEDALAYIGYVDKQYFQQSSDGQPNQSSTSSYSDDVEIL